MSTPETDKGVTPEVLRFSKRRRALTWLWFMLTTGLLAGVLVFANLLAIAHPVYVDFTMEKRYSINENTKTLLARIDRDVLIYLTYVQQANPMVDDRALPEAWEQVKNLVEEFRRANPDRIKVRTVDREGDAVVNELTLVFGKDMAANTVFIVCPRGEGQPPNKRSVPIAELYDGDRVTGALKTFIGEARIGAALLQATQDAKRVVYYTAGHKEMVPGPGNDGFGLIQRNLESLHNAALKELDFPKITVVPADADVLLIPGATADFEPRELEVLQAFLEGGGRLFAIPEVGKCPELCKLLEKWGLRPNPDLVIDPMNPADGRFVRVRTFSDHEINVGMRSISFPMPNTRTITLVPDTTKDSKRHVVPLMFAGKEAWAQPVTRERAEAEPDDPRAPCVAACSNVICDKPRDARRPTAKIVAWGSMVAFSNWNLRNSKGDVREDYVNYILNHFRWLMDEEGMISAMPLRLERRPLELTETQRGIMFWIAIVALPGIGILLGSVAWLFRRA